MLFIIVSAMACMVDTATGQEICGDRKEIVADLANKYHEAQIGFGLDKYGRLVEFWASPEGSYTMLSTNPDGVTCLVSTGHGWQVIEVPKRGI